MQKKKKIILKVIFQIFIFWLISAPEYFLFPSYLEPEILSVCLVECVCVRVCEGGWVGWYSTLNSHKLPDKMPLI